MTTLENYHYHCFKYTDADQLALHTPLTIRVTNEQDCMAGDASMIETADPVCASEPVVDGVQAKRSRERTDGLSDPELQERQVTVLQGLGLAFKESTNQKTPNVVF
jgi:hypothetical protein